MSALPPKADIAGRQLNVRFVPKATSHQRCPMFGRGVPKTAIAPTTSSQNGTTPTPGIASRTSPGKSSHCKPSTTNNSAAVTTSTAHPIGGAKLAKAPMTSDTPAMTKASASRNTENLRGVEAVVSVDRFPNSEGAEGSDILTVALWLVGSGADDTPPSAPRNSKLCQLWIKIQELNVSKSTPLRPLSGPRWDVPPLRWRANNRSGAASISATWFQCKRTSQLNLKL